MINVCLCIYFGGRNIFFNVKLIILWVELIYKYKVFKNRLIEVRCFFTGSAIGFDKLFGHSFAQLTWNTVVLKAFWALKNKQFFGIKKILLKCSEFSVWYKYFNFTVISVGWCAYVITYSSSPTLLRHWLPATECLPSLCGLQTSPDSHNQSTGIIRT